MSTNRLAVIVNGGPQNTEFICHRRVDNINKINKIDLCNKFSNNLRLLSIVLSVSEATQTWISVTAITKSIVTRKHDGIGSGKSI